MSDYLINNVKVELDKIPIDLKSDLLFVNINDKNQYLNNREDIDYLLANQLSPLKVVIMGEVKAGKSTLMNTLVGGEISPVGSTETTSVILEIKYGINQKGVIYYNDEETKGFDSEKIYEELTANQHNPEFYSKIERIELQYPLEQLKYIKLVDTPGVGTITEDNELTTKSFIQKSDVVLWVLNVHHLGQVDINNKIDEVERYGKPIILIVNRIDEVDEDEIDEVIDYIEDIYEDQVQAIFLISAQRAFRGIQTDNEALYEQSGMKQLVYHLKNNVEKTADDQKKQIDEASIYAIISKEVMLTERAIVFLNESLVQVKKREKDFEFNLNNVNNALHKTVSIELENFFRKEQDEVQRLFEASNTRMLSFNSSEVESLLTSYLSPDYINAQFNLMREQVWVDNQKRIRNSLFTIIEKIEVETVEFFNEYRELGIELDNYSNVASSNVTGDLVEGAKKGAIVGGAYGVAAAAYTALLGPYAAIVSVGTALSAALPPVLLIGAATGAAIKFVNKDKKTKNIQEQINDQFASVRLNVKKAMHEEMESMLKENNDIFDQCFRDFKSEILKNHTLAELEVLSKKLSVYLSKIKELKRNNVKQLNNP